MSEYYFDYKCISMASDNRGNDEKALKFYLYQDYKKNRTGEMQVQVVIDEKIRKNYCAVAIYKNIGGVTLPSITNKYDDFYSCVKTNQFGDNVKLILDDNSIFLDSVKGELSGVGIIAFYKKRDKDGNIITEGINFDVSKSISVVPDAEDLFKYSINFAKKDIITYQIIESKSKSFIQIIYPFIRKPIVLDLVKKMGSKPITVSDFNNEENIVKQIKLEKSSRNKEIKQFTFKDEADGYDFRLTFNKDYKDYEKYYKLIDVSEYTIEDKKRIIRNIKMQKSKKVKKSDSCSIVTVGYPEAGKTMFLASLFNYQMKNDRLRSESFILNAIEKAFGKDGETISNLKSSFDDDKIDDDTIKARYTLSVGTEIESRTNISEPTIEYPIVYNMPGLGMISFYDVPGELFKAADKYDETKIFFADGFLALIDGASRASKALEDLKASLAKLDKLVSKDIIEKYGSIENMPIAIVLTKFDQKLKSYVDESNPELSGSYFDENCHNTIENVISLFPSNKKYKGSILEKHINDSSYELEHYLRGLSNSENTFDSIIENYTNIKFFASSSLGTNYCLSSTNSNNKKEVLFRPRRFRMELPIIWLMYQMGLIKK